MSPRVDAAVTMLLLGALMWGGGWLMFVLLPDAYRRARRQR